MLFVLAWLLRFVGHAIEKNRRNSCGFRTISW
jgi:uncharacterized membrane protein YGL010W